MARLSTPVFVTMVCFAACGGGAGEGPGGEWPGDMPDEGSTPTEDVAEDTAGPVDDTALLEEDRKSVV